MRLLIEQKNGVLEETGEGLVKRYGRETKNVAEQVQRSLDMVREKFRSRRRSEDRLTLDYLIYCPDYHVKNVNAAAPDTDRVVDASSDDGICVRIDRVLGLVAKLRSWPSFEES